MYGLLNKKKIIDDQSNFWFVSDVLYRTFMDVSKIYIKNFIILRILLYENFNVSICTMNKQNGLINR